MNYLNGILKEEIVELVSSYRLSILYFFVMIIYMSYTSHDSRNALLNKNLPKKINEYVTLIKIEEKDNVFKNDILIKTYNLNYNHPFETNEEFFLDIKKKNENKICNDKNFFNKKFYTQYYFKYFADEKFIGQYILNENICNEIF